MVSGHGWLAGGPGGVRYIAAAGMPHAGCVGERMPLLLIVLYIYDRALLPPFLPAEHKFEGLEILSWAGN